MLWPKCVAAVVLVGLAASCGPKPLEEVPPEELTVLYGHAGLTHVAIRNARLAHTWHRLKKGLKVLRQDLSSYDRYFFGTRLTSAQMEKVRAWMATHDVFSFAEVYPPEEPDIYAAAFRSLLDVRAGARVRRTTWHGNSPIPKTLRAAVSELIELCKRIRTEKGVTESACRVERIPTEAIPPLKKGR